MFAVGAGDYPPFYRYAQMVRLFSSLTFTAMLYMIAKTTINAVKSHVSLLMTNEPVFPSKSNEVDTLSLQFSPMK